jgi:hypothetical protein
VLEDVAPADLPNTDVGERLRQRIAEHHPICQIIQFLDMPDEARWDLLQFLASLGGNCRIRFDDQADVHTDLFEAVLQAMPGPQDPGRCERGRRAAIETAALCHRDAVIPASNRIVISGPVVISHRLVNLANDTESVRLSFLRDGRWQQHTAGRAVIASRRLIVDLAAVGLPVTSNNAGALVQFLSYVSFSGPQATMKTTVAIEICACHTRGQKMPLCGTMGLPAGHVLCIHAEDGADEVEEAFEGEGGDFSRWIAMPAITRSGDPLNILDHLEEIEGLILEHGVRLVVIDGQNSVVGAPDISTDMKARYNLTNRLHQFAQKLDVVGVSRCW